MKFDVYDPAIHGREDWAEVEADTATAAALKHMGQFDPLDYDSAREYPVLVRGEGQAWKSLSIGIGHDGDDNESVWYWEDRGRWCGSRVTPPDAT